MRKLLPRLTVLWLLVLPARSFATAVVIDFDSLADGDILTTQFPGVTFTNAIVLTAGMSLNEFDFPPHSGLNVASDNDGPIRIDFATPASDVSGYFTYNEPLTLSAFGPGDMLLGSTSSSFSENFVSSGNPPNEFLQLAFTNIAYVTFTGDPLGESFTLDDLTYSSAATSVAEPDTASLLSAGVFIVGLFRLRRMDLQRLM
jgi:hypothetical protein